jgi:glycosyltransferase involved in cell wall biosynthesis
MGKQPDRMRRILHVFSTFGLGGAETRFVNIANALGPKYEHFILAMNPDFSAAAGLGQDVVFAREAMAVSKTGSVSMANIWNARRLLKSRAPDVLVTYNWGSIEWSLANWPGLCRHIHIEDGFGPDEAPFRQKRSRVLARRVLLSKADCTVVPSTVLYDIAVNVWRLPRQKLHLLPNGIDCTRFARSPDAAVLESLGIASEGLVVGTVAGLRPEKNLARLFRAFAALPPDMHATLVIVGDGPERAALSRLAQQLGIGARTIMTGALKKPEQIIGRFSLFALSSDTEQMPNAVLEAMAAGLSIVATDVGDVRRMVAGENSSYIVPTSDESGLALALETLLRDSKLRNSIGSANRQHVRATYPLEAMVAAYDALFSGKGIAASTALS